MNSKGHRTRKQRRNAKKLLAFGPKANPLHKRLGGRTGTSKRNESSKKKTSYHSKWKCVDGKYKKEE